MAVPIRQQIHNFSLKNIETESDVVDPGPESDPEPVYI